VQQKGRRRRRSGGKGVRELSGSSYAWRSSARGLLGCGNDIGREATALQRGEKGHMIPYLRGEMGNTLVDGHFQECLYVTVIRT
jgi:hypothetical protein